jgi:hypothetical protein
LEENSILTCPSKKQNPNTWAQTPQLCKLLYRRENYFVQKKFVCRKKEQEEEGLP